MFEIDEVIYSNPITYKLKDYLGEIIEGSFYEQELQKTKLKNLWLVEKTIKNKGDKSLVKWIGFSNKHNSWIDKGDFIDFK